ncbi:hypothetical protein PR002_g6962 [Phytophthora rubi]|uniref:Uncharacterized protein n=1 Tax=Phytophthora rubi TaxID=129364 RepID=A0A6A3MZR1_9STRA|nr:hypothetical protein PR002_g6962 [Phytophthora rubi]
MAVTKINNYINELNWPQFLQTPPGQPVVLGEATLAEWEEFVDSEDQALESTHMEWADGRILIVEVPSTVHGKVTGAIEYFLNHDALVENDFLTTNRDAFVETRRRLEPDTSYGPVVGTTTPLVGEVGVSRTWGHQAGHLDWKADQWATFPGVEYVLCVATDEDLSFCQYKLHSVTTVGAALTPIAPIDVVAPQTVVRMDCWGCLQLPHHYHRRSLPSWILTFIKVDGTRTGRKLRHL